MTQPSGGECDSLNKPDRGRRGWGARRSWRARQGVTDHSCHTAAAKMWFSFSCAQLGGSRSWGCSTLGWPDQRGESGSGAQASREDKTSTFNGDFGGFWSGCQPSPVWHQESPIDFEHYTFHVWNSLKEPGQGVLESDHAPASHLEEEKLTHRHSFSKARRKSSSNSVKTG